MNWLIKLFRPEKKASAGLVKNLYTAINEATTVAEVEHLQTTIEDEMRSFWISSTTQAGLWMLYQYCNKRRGQLSEEMQNGTNRITIAEFNKRHN